MNSGKWPTSSQVHPSPISAKPQASSSYLRCYREFDLSTWNALRLHLRPPFQLCWKQTSSEAGIILRLASLVSKWCIIADERLFIEGSLEVKLPTIWTDEKQSREEAERRERLEERRAEEKE